MSTEKNQHEKGDVLVTFLVILLICFMLCVACVATNIRQQQAVEQAQYIYDNTINTTNTEVFQAHVVSKLITNFQRCTGEGRHLSCSNVDGVVVTLQQPNLEIIKRQFSFTECPGVFKLKESDLVTFTITVDTANNGTTKSNITYNFC